MRTISSKSKTSLNSWNLSNLSKNISRPTLNTDIIRIKLDFGQADQP